MKRFWKKIGCVTKGQKMEAHKVALPLTIFFITALLFNSINCFNNIVLANDKPAADSQSSNFSDDHYEKGMVFLKQRQYSKAIDELKMALEITPGDTSIKNNLAVAYSSRATYYYNKNLGPEKAANDYRNALYYLKYYDSSNVSETISENLKVTEDNLKNIMILQKLKTTPEERLKKAKELRGQGEFIPAAVEFIYAAEKSELSYESYIALGDIMKTIGHDIQSAEYYDKALKIKDTDPELHLKFARILYKIGNIQAAVNEYNSAVTSANTKEEALSSLESIWRDKIKENSNDATAHMNLGAVLQKKDNLDGAMNEYKTAQLLDPQNPILRLDIATLFQQQGNDLMALSAYDSILNVYPNDVLTHYYKATALKKLGRINEAITEYETVLGLDASNDKAKKELLEAVNLLPPAQGLDYLYQSAIKNPQDATVQYNFAYMLHSQKRNDEALAYYQRALQVNPKLVDAYLNMASIYKEKKMNDQALEMLKKAQEIQPANNKIKESISNYNNDLLSGQLEKASALYDKKDYHGALKIYQSMSSSVEVYLGKGACYQEMENYDEAIKNYQEAVKLDGGNSDAYYYLGLAYYYKENLPEAQKALDKAKQLDPTNKDVQEALKTLASAQSDEYMNKGLDYYNSGQYTESLKYINSAILKCSSNAYAYYYRGLTYDALKKYHWQFLTIKKLLNFLPV
ncbi:MAG: tetratricopeptide repeat protein [Candidatus Gastranaerophilaceae bacterium]|jgi:superkiller protein 3